MTIASPEMIEVMGKLTAAIKDSPYGIERFEIFDNATGPAEYIKLKLRRQYEGANEADTSSDKSSD